MLVLFETSAGFALFKVLDEGKLSQINDIYKEFSDIDLAKKIISLKEFSKFKNTSDALNSVTALVESKLSKDLKKFLKKQIINKKLNDVLAVSDPKLGSVIKEKLGIQCIYDSAVNELMRGIRLQLENLIGGISETDLNSMSLGLSHSLSRYKLKFSPDKVDTMIVQAISLLDDLDKELNTYAMRVREWYGWHFPELTKIIPDNILFAKTVKKMGNRNNASNIDFSDFLPNELEEELKEAALVSMGTEISEEDIENIIELCDQVISISEYREQLSDYLKNRMHAIAPNLTVLVGELVGARLIAHAGSLLNLAKYPASTIQILGAEKALFRALKTKHETPKYGLIFHASLVGQTPLKYKGKISRVLAAKVALACRYDALGESEHVNTDLALEARTKVESRLKNLETGQTYKLSGTGKGKAKMEKYDYKVTVNNQSRQSTNYSTINDSTIGIETEKTDLLKESTKEQKESNKEEKKKKKKKDKKKDVNLEEEKNSMEELQSTEEKKHKKKKRKETNEEEDLNSQKKKKKKKKEITNE